MTKISGIRGTPSNRGHFYSKAGVSDVNGKMLHGNEAAHMEIMRFRPAPHQQQAREQQAEQQQQMQQGGEQRPVPGEKPPVP